MTEEFQRRRGSGGCHDNNNDNNDNNNAVDPIPPPTVIERVKIDKVYEECKVVDVNEVEIPIDGTSNAVDPEDIEDVKCVSVKVKEDTKKCKIPNKKQVQLTFDMKIKYKVNGNIKEHVEPVEKTVRLSRAGEEGLQPQCEIFLECLDAFVTTDEEDNPIIILCIGKLILFKLFAHVQLLIPAYGFAPQPPECPEVLEECPEYEPEWPPYPEQF